MQPPAGTQRLMPSGVALHTREQQSMPPTHGSPTCREHVRPSAAVQVASVAQRPGPLPPPAHDPEQQSVPVPQISPATRQASTNAQRWPTQDPLQHWLPPVHDSPAGAQEPPGSTHFPPVHTLLQQSVATLHGAPAKAQSGASAQVPPSPAVFTQLKVQHAPA
jgi:hypothetical protein